MGRNDHHNRNRKVQIANASRRNEMAADLGRRGIAAIKWVLFATIPARLASIRVSWIDTFRVVRNCPGSPFIGARTGTTLPFT